MRINIYLIVLYLLYKSQLKGQFVIIEDPMDCGQCISTGCRWWKRAIL